MGTGFGTESAGPAAFNGQVVGNENAAQLGYDNPNLDSIALAEVLFATFDSAKTVKINFYGMGYVERGPLYIKDVTDTWTQITDFPNDGGDTEYTATVNGFRGIRWGAGDGIANGGCYVNLQGVTVDGKMLVDTGISGNPVTGSNLTFNTPNPDLQYFKKGDNVGTSSGFTPVIYTGNDGTQSIDCGFSPDLVWLKNRDAAYGHVLFDTIRGAGNYLQSDTTGAEQTGSSALTSFDSNGFTVGGSAITNNSGQGIVAWCWDAGDTTVTNNDGTIESQVRSNGAFSIISYVGTGNAVNIGHGLSGVPGLVITKNISRDTRWLVYHYSTGLAKNGFLNLPSEFSNTTFFGASPFTELTFSTGGGNYENSYSGDEYVTYAWAETPGVSSFGKYTGTGAAGTQIDVGFEPAFVMVKNTTSSNDWIIIDSARTASVGLWANTDGTESAQGSITGLTSNGFTLGADGEANVSGQTYIYAAFAGSNPIEVIDVDVANNQMTVDGGNWAAYNQSQVWSDGVSSYSQAAATPPATKDGMFDGNITTFTQAWNDTNVVWTGNIPVVDSFITVIGHNEGGSNTFTVTDAAGTRNFSVPASTNDEAAAGSLSPVTVPVTSPVTGININYSGSSRAGISQITADGKVLVDSSVTPTGETKVTGGTYQGTGTVVDVDVTNKQMLLSDVTSRWLERYRAETLTEVEVAKTLCSNAREHR